MKLLTAEDFTLHRIRRPDLLLFEAVSGSHAYGTDTESSDLDLKGVFAAPDALLSSMESIEQVSDTTNDEVYYELVRFVALLQKNNPTALELLFSPEDYIRYKHPAFDLINPTVFLSRLCEKSFCGYAEMQIKKARGLNKKIVNPEPRIQRHLREFCHVLEGQGSVPLTDWLLGRSFDEENCGLVSVNHEPGIYALFYSQTENYRGLFTAKDDAAILCSSVPKEAQPEAWLVCNYNAFRAHCRAHREYWHWVEQRNENRYKTNSDHGRGYDSKNLMHTIRLLDMAEEIAKEQTIRVRRPNARQLLEIKEGKFSYEELLLLSERKIKEIHRAFHNSSLPPEPDRRLTASLLREVQLRFSHSR